MRKNGLKKAVSLLCVSSLLFGDMNLGSIDFNLIARAETLIDELSTESRSTAVEINEINFPDGFFRNYVRDNFDEDGDGILSESEIQAVTEIDVSSCVIVASLEGIQFFSNLRTLDCSGNQLRELDVSGLTNLNELDCRWNVLKELNVSGLTNLGILDCDVNNLRELDVTNLTSLISLNCSDNKLGKLDMSGVTNLKFLVCGSNNLRELDVTSLSNLNGLNCSDNNLSELDVTGLPNLKNLSCYSNNLYELTVSEEMNGTVNAGSGYCINNENGTKDISIDSLPGLDASRMSNLQGGTLQDGILHFDDYRLSYDYEIGNGQTCTFSLYLLNASHDGFSMKLENGDTLRISGQSAFNTSEFRYLEKTNLPIHNVILEEGITAFQHDSQYSDFDFISNCKSIYFPASCTDISMDDMEKLESITVASENPNYTAEEGVLYTKDQTELLYVPCSLTELNISENATIIREYACNDNTGIEKVVIPANVEVIEDYAIMPEITVEFAPGSHLKKLGDIFPSLVTDLSMLENTTELEEIEFTGVGVTVTDLSIFEKLPKLKKISGIYATNETQEYITQNVEYQMTFALGEKLSSSYTESMYTIKNESGKIPLYYDHISSSLSDIESSLFDENNVACKAGSETVFYSVGLRLWEEEGEYPGAHIPVKITVVDWDSNPELENDENIEMELDVDSELQIIKDANQNLWEVTDITNFTIERRAENVKEYLADTVYLDSEEGPYTQITSLQYLSQNNVLYSNGNKVAENVKKYNTVYALTENGELKNMEGQTLMTDVSDFAFVGVYSYYGEIEINKFVVLKKDGTLYSFSYGQEQDLQFIDSNVAGLLQGQTHTYYEFASVEYLKTNGEVYSLISNGESHLTVSDVSDMLACHIFRKTDGSISYARYQFGQQITPKEIFKAGNDIVAVYNTESDTTPYRIGDELEDYIFVDSNGAAWGINKAGETILLTEHFSKYIYGGFIDTNGNRYSYADGQLGQKFTNTGSDELKIENQILYRNDIPVMTNVLSAKEFGNNQYIIFTRTDGTIWLMNLDTTGDNPAPVCVASFAKTDKDTGVDITYEDGTPFTGDTDIAVTDVTTEESYDLYRKAAEQLGSLEQLFDITMTSNGVTVQPERKLKVSIPLPEGMDEASAKVYHIDETGTATDMNAVCENGKLTFVTDHFSVYAVVSDDGMKGDVNQDGKIDMLDYTLLRRAIANWDVEIDENNADVDGNGKLTLVDSTMIRRYIAGWDIKFQ